MAVTVAAPIRLVADGFCLTEAPRWHGGRLWFSDIYGQKVHALGPDGRVETVVELPEHTSGLGFMPNGDLLVVQMESAKVLRVAGGKASLHADVSRFADEHINDMAVDAGGRAYVTQLGPPRVAGSTAPRYTRIVAIEPDGSSHVGAEGLRGPNGIGITEDGRTLVVCEAGGAKLTRLDIAADGALSNARPFAELEPGQCPDGMCLDAQGGVWAAVVVNLGPPTVPGPGFCRYDAEGRLTHVVPLPAGRHAVACCFGGEGRRTLYLCTSGHITGAEALKARSARIEAVEVQGFSGAGVP